MNPAFPAAVLAAVLVMAGCIAPEPAIDNNPGPTDGDTAGNGLAPLVESFTGTASANALAPWTAEHTFAVPANATGVRATLAWPDSGDVLDFVLLDPRAREVASGWAESGTARATAVAVPEAGTWTVRLRSERAMDAAYSLEVTVNRAAAAFMSIPFDHEVAAATGVPDPLRIAPRSFAEINLAMDAGQFFNSTWTTSSNGYFNIHYHSDGATERAVELRDRAHGGNFTAPHPEVFSLLWRNEGTEPVSVEALVEGVFLEHSRTR